MATYNYREGNATRNDTKGDYNRPRRPNPDTVSYLVSLPLDVPTCRRQIQEYVEHLQKCSGDDQASSIDFPPLLGMALSALDEVQNEMASLAGDERGSQIMEQLFHMVLPYSETAARLCWNGMAGYHVFLATHRYGSHVVQTLLQLSGSGILSLRQDLGLDEEGPVTEFRENMEKLASLRDSVQGMAEELTPHAPSLVVHVCGSHVLRSLICLLGGVQPRPSSHNSGSFSDPVIRRGKSKNKKRKKKNGTELTTEDAGTHASMRVKLSYSDPAQQRIDVSELRDTVLTGFLDVLWSEDSESFSEERGVTRHLQRMASHASAGPLLTISIRVLAYVYLPDPTLWHQPDLQKSRFPDRLATLEPEPRYQPDSPCHGLVRRLLRLDDDDAASDTIYALAGEPYGSRVLETILRISPDEVYQRILERGDFARRASDFVQHSVGNFVFQTLLATARTQEQSQVLAKSLEKTVLSGHILDSKNHRRGLLWRLVEMIANHGVGQEAFLKALRIGMGIVIYGKADRGGDAKESEEIPASNEDDEEAKKKKKKQRQRASSIPLSDCVPPLLDVVLPKRDGDRLRVDVSGARTVYHLLRFSPRLCGDVLHGVVNHLPREDLEFVAKDGLGSRCIMDGILEGPVQEKTFSKATKSLLENLKGRWIALASDRVGHHTVKKLFEALSVDDKAILTAELAQGTNRLSGSSMGRNIMEVCSVSEFLRGEKEWKEGIRKRRQREEWLHELLEANKPEQEAKKKRKRKRKKSGKGVESIFEKTESTSAVDAIMETISNARKKTK